MGGSGQVPAPWWPLQLSRERQNGQAAIPGQRGREAGGWGERPCWDRGRPSFGRRLRTEDVLGSKGAEVGMRSPPSIGRVGERRDGPGREGRPEEGVPEHRTEGAAQLTHRHSARPWRDGNLLRREMSPRKSARGCSPTGDAS